MVRSWIGFVGRVARRRRGLVVLLPQSEIKEESNGILRNKDELLLLE